MSVHSQRSPIIGDAHPHRPCRITSHRPHMDWVRPDFINGGIGLQVANISPGYIFHHANVGGVSHVAVLVRARMNRSLVLGMFLSKGH